MTDSPETPTGKISSSVKRTVFVLFAMVAVVLGLTANKYGRTPGLDREQIRQQGVVLFETPRSFDMDELVSHDGQPFTSEKLKGGWTLLYFGFTFCPDVCPTTLAKLDHLSKEFAELDPSLPSRFKTVMVSVDPRRDTPEKLAGYVPFFNKSFIGVTGEPAALEKLTRQLNVAFEFVGDQTEEDYLVEHSMQVVLINPQGDYQGFIKPQLEPVSLAKTLQSIDASL